MRPQAAIDGLDPRIPIAVIGQLTTAVGLVFNVMESGEWLTIPQIQHRVQKLPAGRYFSESCISARIRDQRKAKHGGYIVDRRLRAGTRNLYEYKLITEIYPEAA